MKQQPSLNSYVTGLLGLSLLFCLSLTEADAKNKARQGSTDHPESVLVSHVEDYVIIETLTGGDWVTLSASDSVIEATNQPLRITYASSDLIDKDTAETQNQNCLKLSEVHARKEPANDAKKQCCPKAGIKPKTNFPSHLDYRDHKMFSRLATGLYALDINSKNPKPSKPDQEYKTLHLKITEVQPEPPIIGSIDKRLAREEGKLSLKLKNVVAGDQVSFFVDGNPEKKRKLKAKDLGSYLKFDNVVLRPGTSNIIARLTREKSTSEYSNSPSVTSRVSPIMHRDLEINNTDFENTSSTDGKEIRVLTNTSFKLVSKNRKAKKAEAKCVSPDKLTKQINDLRDTLKNEIKIIIEDQINPLDQKIGALESSIEDFRKDVSDISSNSKTITETLEQIQTDLKILKIWAKYQNSGWRENPVFSWHTKKQDQNSQKVNQAITPKAGKPITLDKKISDDIVKKCIASNEFTLDITFKVMDPHYATNQLMRIISFSKDLKNRNFTLGQFEDNFVFRLRTNKTDKNGLINLHDGTKGIHFFKNIQKDNIYNVVISYSKQKLRFWVNRKEVLIDFQLKSPNGIADWTNDCRLILGNEFGMTNEDRKWRGKIYSFSIRDVGVSLPKPDSDSLKLLSLSSPMKQPILTNPELFQVSSHFQKENHDKNVTSKSRSASNSEDSVSKKITVREFAFPYPASFPIPRFSRYGKAFDSEGAVLDRMHILIAKDGKFKLIYDVRTTVRAEIDLQLQVKLNDGAWYPITLPKQTVYPPETNPLHSNASREESNKERVILGYSSLFATKSSEIKDIRRRGTAVFGTRPVDSSY